jgi:ribosomal-protein-alanine N-acetyltransferase
MTRDPGAVSLERLRWWDLEEVLPIEVDLFGADAWTPGQFWSELARVPETRWYVLARQRGTLVGYAGLFQAGDEADVQTVAVAGEAQGRGIGRLLVEALVVEAAARGASVLHLEVRSGNQVAQGLYDRLGFQVVGRRPDYYGRGRDAVLMTRRLPAADPASEEVAHG